MEVKRIIITKISDGAGGVFKLSKPDVYENPNIKRAVKVLKNAVLDKNIFGINITPKKGLAADIFSAETPEYLAPNIVTNDFLKRLGIGYKQHKLSEHITVSNPVKLENTGVQLLADAEQMEAKHAVKGDHMVNGIYF